jgi:uncharacterized protein (TIGR02270 family)
MSSRAAPIPFVLTQHVESAGTLWLQRRLLTGAPGAKLHHVGRFDERLSAHLDGLSVAGEDGWPFLDAALEAADAGSVFAIAVRAIETHDFTRLTRLCALVEAEPKCAAGLSSALGWMEESALRGLVVTLLNHSQGTQRLLGVTACALHRVDPGIVSGRFFDDPEATIRARAWRAAGELGKRELVSTAAAAIVDAEPACQFWAAWAAVMLGDKHSALDVLASIAEGPGPFRARAFQLVLQAKGAQSAHGWLASLAKDPQANQRWLIRGAGLVADPTYVPWLIGHMADQKTMRLAGEAFSLITGLDLARLDLEVKPPQNFESGPNDDPNDSNVDMDEDDGLPWPDAAKIQAWWNSNSGRFQPGTRYFMGEPLNRDNCLRVLKEGYQRQRIAAAVYLSLLNPGTPLFEWRAPARRQQRLLAEMS